MYKVLHREELASRTVLLQVAAPEVARKTRSGQFVVVIPDEQGERIPLTIADWDPEAGTVTIVFQVVGTSTHKLAHLSVGGEIPHFVGPLGQPSEVELFGTVAVVGGGVGIAAIAPIARALKQAGNRMLTIMGARNKDLLFWENKLARVSDQLMVTTDDGSYGRKGVVTQPLSELLQGGERIDRVIAVGPTVMMRFVAKTTQPYGVKTMVSLNPIMVDGTGMCGCCRVSVGGQTRFACVDGPDFDGHLVDWDLLAARQGAYSQEEKHSLECLERLAPSPREGKYA